jgi:hypothetical protein
MRESARFNVFLVVFGVCSSLLLCGILYAGSSNKDIFDRVASPTETQPPAEEPLDAILGRAAESRGEVQVIVLNGQTRELFNGDLFLSAQTSNYYEITCGSPDHESTTFYNVRTGETGAYYGKCRFEVRVLAIYSDGMKLLVTNKGSYLVPGIPNAVIYVCLGLVGCLGFVVVVLIKRKPKTARRTTTTPQQPVPSPQHPAPQPPTYQEATVSITDEKQDQVQVSYLLMSSGDGKNLYRKIVAGHWQYVQVGWTEGQVRQLLGAPVSVKPAKAASGEPVSVWAYGGGLMGKIGGGIVTFSGGKVVGFKSPPSGFCRYVYHGPNTKA